MPTARFLPSATLWCLPSAVCFSAWFTPLAGQATASAGEPWRIITPPQATLVLGRDGTVIGEIGRERRLSVPLRTLPRYVGQAFIAVEDKRFYQHDGVDLVGVAGALKDAVTKGNLRGASTITQLLVGNMHPDVIDRRDRSPARKLREQQAAREMERHYSKEQILEAFLNQLDFGRGGFGIEMAARTFFGKPAAELTLAEAASLASMPKSPTIYDPSRNTDRNRERRNTVLTLMAEQGYITAAQAAAAQREPVRTVRRGERLAPWVTDVVRVQADRAGVNVMNGGYRIQTTIDPALQRSAQRALTEGIDEIESRPGFRGLKCATNTTPPPSAANARQPRVDACLEGAVLVIDPATGDVRALVGGRDYARSSFNRAIDGNRQPGSSFKAFVYAQAIGQGLTANAIVADTALRVRLDNGQIYSPDNADNEFLGALTVREALTRSRNPVAVQLAMSVGMDSVIALARRAGLRAPIAPYPSSALGASVVQPLDFVAAYASFDNGGVGVDPRFIVRIEDRTGRTVFTPQGAPMRPAMDPRVAFIVRDIMQDVVARGTATALRRLVPERIPVAGKTGTTNDNTDVWFVGMTPELVTGVWLGFDKPAMIAPGAAGGTLAAPIAGRIIAAAYENRTAGAWTPPPGVVAVDVDRVTGKPADTGTPADRKIREWFLIGTEPGALAWPLSLFRLGPIGY
ncbi:penicillin-binding protein 1A [Gemmatimonas sp.]|uniref:penicillin-binding protein 1A n=1 Tax=Gemmatimonas sp. TaxID=1962908 RepID=UPI0027BAFC51|nr:PBP1A family penicillin-binding protein [Gemmatimonas sp.]